MYSHIPTHTSGILPQRTVDTREKRRQNFSLAGHSSRAIPEGTHDGPLTSCPKLNIVERIIKTYHRHVNLSRTVHDPIHAIEPFIRLAAASEIEFILDLSTDIAQNFGLSVDTALDTNFKLATLLAYQRILRRHLHSLTTAIDSLSNWDLNSLIEAESDLDHGPTSKGDGVRCFSNSMGNSMSERSETECHRISLHIIVIIINGSTRSMKLMVSDFQHVFKYAEAALEDCLQCMSVVANRASIRESEKAVAEARDVTKLTRLATIFIPLTFITSVFGMNVREISEESGPPLWVWVVCSLATGLVTWLMLLI
jgi:hypothetical protein